MNDLYRPRPLFCVTRKKNGRREADRKQRRERRERVKKAWEDGLLVTRPQRRAFAGKIPCSLGCLEKDIREMKRAGEIE